MRRFIDVIETDMNMVAKYLREISVVPMRWLFLRSRKGIEEQSKMLRLFKLKLFCYLTEIDSKRAAWGSQYFNAANGC